MKLSKEKLIEMYRKMWEIRKFEEKAAELFMAGKLPGFLHASVGQEASIVGASAAVRRDDYMTSTHRGHGDIIAKGARLDKMMAELFAKKTGYCKGKGGSMHIADLDLGILGATGIVGAGVPIAAGAALACKMQGTDRLVLCFFGDGGTNTGAFHEALNLAAVWNLPVVFVCQNNEYAESTPRETHQKVQDVATRAKAYDIPGVVVDGNDVLEVYRVAAEAVARARRGEGPTLIECKTYRFMGHYVGDPQTYRSKEEVEERKKRDPILLFERRLIQEGILTAADAERIQKETDEAIAAAVRFAQESPEPEVTEALEDVYA